MANKVILTGNLGADPKVNKSEKNGNSFTTFSLATTENWKNDKGEKQSKTEWHNIIANGKTGELAEKYLKKGSKIYLEGKLRYSSKENEDKTKTYFTNINVDTIEFLDSKPQEENSAE
ncbi:MAG: single-stranded DNA-binding protein [Flavobacteriales bacterium]|nr:MAG: single-stranded DNA-binding protein [Flavobacteriales bacterium]